MFLGVFEYSQQKEVQKPQAQIRQEINQAVETAKTRYILENPQTDPNKEASFEKIAPLLMYNLKFFKNPEDIRILESYGGGKITSLGTYGDGTSPGSPITWEN